MFSGLTVLILYFFEYTHQIIIFINLVIYLIDLFSSSVSGCDYKNRIVFTSNISLFEKLNILFVKLNKLFVKLNIYFNFLSLSISIVLIQ